MGPRGFKNSVEKFSLCKGGIWQLYGDAVDDERELASRPSPNGGNFIAIHRPQR